jgi:flagellar biosynthesis protein
MADERRAPEMAVAVRYDGRGAPRVTAKGRGEVAKQIVALARSHGVPLEENAPVAELLSRVELGAEIPAELYLAVAIILRFAYELSGKPIPLPRAR